MSRRHHVIFSVLAAFNLFFLALSIGTYSWLTERRELADVRHREFTQVLQCVNPSTPCLTFAVFNHNDRTEILVHAARSGLDAELGTMNANRQRIGEYVSIILKFSTKNKREFKPTTKRIIV